MTSMFDNMNEQGASRDPSLDVAPVTGVSKVKSVFGKIAGGMEGYQAPQEPAVLPYRPNLGHKVGAFLQGAMEGLGRAAGNIRQDREKEFAQGQEERRTKIGEQGADIEKQRLQLTREQIADEKKRALGQAKAAAFKDALTLGVPHQIARSYIDTVAGMQTGENVDAGVDQLLKAVGPYAQVQGMEADTREYVRLYLAENPDKSPAEAMNEVASKILKKKNMLDELAQLQLDAAKRAVGYESEDRALARYDKLGEIRSRYTQELSAITEAMRRDPSVGGNFMSVLGATGGDADSAMLAAMDAGRASTSPEIKNMAKRIPVVMKLIDQLDTQMRDLGPKAGIPGIVETTPDKEAPAKPAAPSFQIASGENEADLKYSNPSALHAIIPDVMTRAWNSISTSFSNLGAATNEAVHEVFGKGSGSPVLAVSADFQRLTQANDSNALARLAANVPLPLDAAAAKKAGYDVSDPKTARMIRSALIQKLLKDNTGDPYTAWSLLVQHTIGDDAWKRINKIADLPRIYDEIVVKPTASAAPKGDWTASPPSQ